MLVLLILSLMVSGKKLPFAFSGKKGQNNSQATVTFCPALLFAPRGLAKDYQLVLIQLQLFKWGIREIADFYNFLLLFYNTRDQKIIVKFWLSNT